MENSTEKNTIKSLILVGTAWPFRGGFTNFNQRLVRTFMELGVRCRIFTFTTQYPNFLFPGKSQFTDAPAPEGLDITRCLSSVNPFSWIRTGRMIRREHPDVIVVRYWIPALAPALGKVCRMARRRRIRVIALLDNVVPHEKRFGDKLLTRYFIRSVDGFIYMSDQVLGELRRFTADKPALFSPHPMFDNYGEPLDRQAACQALKLDPSFRYTLFFGYIRDYKGLDLLLEAWGRLKHSRMLPTEQRHRLLIAGEYYGDRGRYDALIDRLGIGEDIVQFDRFIEENEVGKFFSAADLVVQPYRSATQSGVTQVAYYFDVPMIVTDVGGLREIVPDGEVGFVVDPDPNSIAEGIRRFYAENLSATFRSNIIEYRKRFTWEHMAQDFGKMYGWINDLYSRRKK